MKEYNVTLSVCATTFIEANSEEEAKQIALDNFNDGRQSLIESIDLNGYEAEIDSIMEENNNE